MWRRRRPDDFGANPEENTTSTRTKTKTKTNTKTKTRTTMSTHAHNQDGYLLLFRGTDWHKGLSPEEMQQVVGRWKAWYDRLMAEGKVAAGNPLENTGKVISGRNGGVVADGPFAESKEAIGGYFLLTVQSETEAVAIARQCPGLPHGAVVEVRPIADMCPVAREAYTSAPAPAMAAAV